MAAARKKQAPKPASKGRDIRAGASEQPSVRTFTLWTPALVQSAEIQADNGNLRQAANLCDWLLGDDRVRGTLDTRVQTLLGLDPTFEPSGDKRRSNRAVRALEADEDWYDGWPESELAGFHTWGLLLGVSYGQHQWQVSENHGGRVLPYPEQWHAQHLRFDWNTRRWLSRVQSGAEVEVVAGDGTWILHTPYGKQRPWAMGLWRGLAPWVLLKHYARQDSGRFGEKSATLAVTSELGNDGAGDGETTKEQRSDLANDIYNRGRDGVIVLPPGFDMKLVTEDAKDLYDAQIAMANTAIAIAIRGGNLTTEVSQGGSRAATESQERTGDLAKLKFDAQSVTTTFHDQSLTPWADLNFGDPNLAPWPVYPVEPEEDLKAKAEQLNVVTTAADRLLQSGVPVDMVALCEQFEVPLVKGSGRPFGSQIFQYHVTAGVLRKNELRERLGFGPMPGGDEIARIGLGGHVLEPASTDSEEPPVDSDDPEQEPAPEESEDADSKTDGESNDRMVAELQGATRAIVVGGPRSGKSTITVRASERHGRQARHADALVGKLKWSEISEEVSRWIDADGDWIIEGVSAVRALRKWLKRNPEAKLDATIVWLAKPIQSRTKRQRAMAKGIATVWNEIRDELVSRGARLIERDS